MQLKKGMHIHFVGVGGVGMSAAASLAYDRGAVVSGCDLQSNRYTHRLEALGCRIAYRHDPAHLDGADMVVYSSAVRPDAPELERARQLELPVYKRAIFTILLMSDRTLIGIAGSHGKTTTTWMTAHPFIAAMREPSLMVGGTVPEIYGNFRIGSGACFISEVDESDGTIAEIHPQIAVVTNIDREHMNYYSDMARLEEAFASFCGNVPADGTAVLYGGDPACMRIAAGLACKVLTYGMDEKFDISASKVRVQGLHALYDILYQGERFKDVRLLFSGEHNILNSLAAFGAAVSGGLSRNEFIRGLETCRPVARRFEMAGNMDDVICINDYAHHPTEIGAVIDAVKRHLPAFRKIYVFQPHRYTRLRDCWDRFLNVFNTTTNILIVLPVYSANEAPIEGCTSQRFVEVLNERGVPAELLTSNLVGRHLDTIVRRGDCVVFLGAGDIGNVYSEYAKRYNR